MGGGSAIITWRGWGRRGGCSRKHLILHDHGIATPLPPALDFVAEIAAMVILLLGVFRLVKG